jgi:NADH-quinone oxidoreductase subunit J
MVLNAGEEERTSLSRVAKFVGLPLAAVFLVEVCYVLYRAWPSSEQMVVPERFLGRTEAIGQALYGEFLLPFELTAILILIALVGAVVLAQKEP